MSLQVTPRSLRVDTRSAGPVWLRALCKDDRAELISAIGMLSSRTRHLRFHSSGFRPTTRELDELLRVDQHDRCAWLLTDRPAGAGIALGRYVRDAAAPDSAELALTICDDHQGRGLAKVLLAALSLTARQAGIARFVGAIMPENHGAWRLAERLGLATRATRGSLRRIEASSDVATWPPTDSAEEVRAYAAAMVEPLKALSSAAAPAMKTCGSVAGAATTTGRIRPPRSHADR